jgi:hypothetical protein
MKEKEWINRAKETYNFHRHMKASGSDWTLAHTSKSLKRSVGSVSEDLLICRWLVTHERQISDFEYARDAIKFIRKKRRELELREIE